MTEPDWAAIRAEYEAGATPVLDLMAKHAIQSRELYWRIENDNWARRRQTRPATRKDLILRLYRLLERQIVELEMTMTTPNDKEAAILGTLTRNLEKLIELDTREHGGAPETRKRTDIAVLRKKLAERIDRLSAE